jgi:hypothetical protein
MLNYYLQATQKIVNIFNHTIYSNEQYKVESKFILYILPGVKLIGLRIELDPTVHIYICEQRIIRDKGFEPCLQIVKFARNKKPNKIGRLLICNYFMAGMEGFEPPNAGTRNQCLTTWRHPISS